MSKQTNFGQRICRRLNACMPKIELLPYAEEWTIFSTKMAGKAEFKGYSGFDMEGSNRCNDDYDSNGRECVSE